MKGTNIMLYFIFTNSLAHFLQDSSCPFHAYIPGHFHLLASQVVNLIILGPGLKRCAPKGFNP
ncbi:hypothetical protein QQP08_017202, partial [Theobroma cacao]